MKKTILLSMLFIAGISISSIAQNIKKEKFKVYGNCGMCETRIEKAAKAVDGVSVADWDKETKMIEVSFDESKTDVHKIHMAIAKAGHDTEMHKASDEVYKGLPGCCQYERAASKQSHDHSKGHDHSSCTRDKSASAASCCSKGN
ncbi:MAG: heavy-metal-associated domain-containing protein [Bacteroidales bacterium]|jgi:copper chaperone CopZ|nr:heavy-metal-associated domain-containing protein [Bacteroidales bacterium]